MTNFSLSSHLPITTYIQNICFRRFTAFVFLEEIIEFFAVIQVFLTANFALAVLVFVIRMYESRSIR